uniref:Nonsense-mediated mRNA decay factor n=1 Tax=Eptatretus burgeri TaxID=7764 RepID=A0A8C4NGC0_EPTBU
DSRRPPTPDRPRLVQLTAKAVVDIVHRLDSLLGSNDACQEVFKLENVILRSRLRELCIKLMFLHPVEYGRKAEELLWRKVYYDVIHLVKTARKGCGSLDCAYRTHLTAGVGFYQHLLLSLQEQYWLQLQGCVDWLHLGDTLAGRCTNVSSKELEWARLACHHCLICLGDLARYQIEVGMGNMELLAERYYHQALAVVPHIGMPFNQLGTLAGSKSYHVDAAYYYMRCIQSEVGFEGSHGNLGRLFIKAKKLYQEIQKKEAITRKHSPNKQRCFPTLCLSHTLSYVTALCQEVLDDFNLCMFYLPGGGPARGVAVGARTAADEPCASGLHSTLVFRMTVMCLISLHNLKKTGTRRFTAAVAFTLALFSHVLNHTNIRLQASLDGGEDDVPVLREGDEGKKSQTKIGEQLLYKPTIPTTKARKGTRPPRLRRRRRRCPGRHNESDLSEDSDSEGGGSGDDHSGASVGSERGDHDEEEVEYEGTDSEADMNSQESRSELEGEEDEVGVEEEVEHAVVVVEGEDDEEAQQLGNLPQKNDIENINAQSNEGQCCSIFASKICCMGSFLISRICSTGSDADSESESTHSEEAAPVNTSRERSLQDTLVVLGAEGLLHTVKVCLDWLLLNPDIVVMCAQVLLVLSDSLQLCSGGVMVAVREAKGRQIVTLPEDVAVRNLAGLREAHRSFSGSNWQMPISVTEQTAVRVACLRSFGHFLVSLRGEAFSYNQELGLFLGNGQSAINGGTSDSVLQAEAQFRMAENEQRRNRLMCDMAQLRLQAEVCQLEGSLQQPRAQAVLSPYLMADPEALSMELSAVRQLACSGRFILLVPRTVIDGLDMLKKEAVGARDAIRFLEAEFRKGNRYIRCQREVGRGLERHRLKRQDLKAW